MISSETKKVLNLQMYFCSLVGSTPFCWNNKTYRISVSKNKLVRIYWITASLFTFSYLVILSLKYMYHLATMKSAPISDADHIFHIYWIAIVSMVSIFDFNNYSYYKSIAQFINNTLDLDDQLTSEAMIFSHKCICCIKRIWTNFTFFRNASNIFHSQDKRSPYVICKNIHAIRILPGLRIGFDVFR